MGYCSAGSVCALPKAGLAQPLDGVRGLNKMLDVTAFKPLYFEDIKVGMRESLMRTVMDEDVVGFAELTGDHNPVHLSDMYAQKTVFGQRIAHGLYTASLISAILGTKLPGPGAVYISQTLEFHGPVKIGDVVTISAEVVELIEKGRRVVLYCEAKVDGQKVLDGQATVSVPKRPVLPQS
jgi:3-hydroxybutyryl-CoA dehydratase